MNHLKAYVFILLIIVFSAVIYAQDAEAGKDISKIIIGKWEIAANERVKTGDITFTSDKKYDLNEKYVDGSGGGTKGGYDLNCDVSPVTLKLCLGGCPGSNWTNNYAIIRILQDDKIEICISLDGNYPAKFLEDKTSGNTMILTKME